MTESKHKDTFYGFVEATANHDAAKALSLLDKDIQINSTLFGYRRGNKLAKEFFDEIYGAFPNLSMVPVPVFSCEDGVIFSDMDIGGRQEGQFEGNPPTRNRFQVRGAFVFELDKPGHGITSISSY